MKLRSGNWVIYIGQEFQFFSSSAGCVKTPNSGTIVLTSEGSHVHVCVPGVPIPYKCTCQRSFFNFQGIWFRKRYITYLLHPFDQHQ